MELDSARGLKQSLSDTLLAPFIEATVQSVQSFALGAKPVRDISGAIPSLALGVAHKSGKQYQLAVRCQREELMNSKEMQQIRKRAKNEVDIRFVGRLRKRATPWNHKKVRPLQIGLSCGHFRITAGTLGCFVRLRNDAAKLFVLSNNHVLADENKARAGDPILQPGFFDGGRNPQELIAKFTKTVKLKTTGANLIDAAIAEITGSLATTANLRTIKGLGKLGGLGPAFVDEGTQVAKVGRTTNLTRGKVTAFELDNVVVTYDMGDVRFDDQIEIEGSGTSAFSAGGDSGSVIVLDGSLEAVALLFAGGDSGGTNGKGLTYANPLHTVLDKLKIDLA
eukprot:TRINITY_DN1942_c0_g1_i11.p1 TRINITY_DN1942_c0_g1~~TRINITY_DN1942_c0_g1_i11.p1  ORF type:complete len:337 (+),score=55.16 TRINITY_DN1942_c0_g1_i11:120-1130(+)